MTIDKKGNCWLSSYAGIWLIDSTLQNRQLISPLHLVDGKVFETEISSQYNDKSGGLWIGTIDRGLLYYHPDRFKFRNFGRSFFKVNNNKSIRVTCLAESNEKVFIGTQNGLYTYEKNAQLLIFCDQIPSNTNCTKLLKDSKQRIWLCSENNGLFHFDDNKINHYSFPFNIQYLFEAYNSVFYFCSNSVVGTFNLASGKFQEIRNAQRERVGEIFQMVKYNRDSLLGISSNGPFYFNCKKNTFEPFSTTDQIKHSNNQIGCILIDSNGFIWFGTQDGLSVYNPSTNGYQSIFEENGLVNNSIRSIIEDKSGKIWVSTSNGISCISKTLIKQVYRFSFANFNQYDGVIENEFSPGSAVKTGDNRILWGGLDGFNEIDLSRLNSSKQLLLTPVFTNFYLSGNEIKVGKEYNGQIILKHSISSIKTIRLKYFQNFIGFEFSALNYVNPTQTYYRYKLDGVDANWNEIWPKDGIGHINYTNLSPGTYRFRVYAANNSKQWGKQSAGLTIVVEPPFWKTSIAYFLYIIMFLGTMFFVFYFLFQWNRKKMLKKQKEGLEQAKLAFYTNISHELKTPLTMILLPLGALIRKYANEPIKSQLSAIYSHAKDLLELVNQLLDFRKIEMNGEVLQLTYCQIDEFLEAIVQSFQETASEKEINLTFQVMAKNLYAYIDKNKMQKIVSNLLSNAIKFTPKGGQVSLTVSGAQPETMGAPKIMLQVFDTGCGIPEKEFSKIFNRFYQSRQNVHLGGNGIGLYLVKQYVQMHNGLVKVKSRLNEGSTFTVEIPNQQQPPEKNQIKTEKKASQSSIKVLVIEDNVKFQSFLLNELSEYYQVITALNGKEGLKKAREQQPDLIITDVMMPEMSGTALCNEIKNDFQVSHIPVVMLTAKSSEQAQVEGFMAGADAYITKPFSLDILLVRIQNLIEQKEQRKKLFKNVVEVNPSSITLTNIDEKLIKTALEHIEKNMDNELYSVEQLSKDMFMDRTNLYRKLSAIVGQTPTEFIRSIRLKRAARLLESGLSVTEVSERVGFSTSSYFSKCFQKEFGVKPSHYRSVKDTNNK